MISFIKLVFRVISYIFKFPIFLVIKLKDLYRYIVYKEYKVFSGYGVHLYIGLFGAGKTLALTKLAHYYAWRYSDLNIYTNYKLIDFPYPERIKNLTNFQQIIDAPPGSLFLIDEISTLFNSREWQKFPPALVYLLLQNRKQRKMILATAQVFTRLDAQIREILFTVRDCKTIFNRWTFETHYNAVEYASQTAVMLRAKPIKHVNFINFDKLRKRYDTDQMIDNMAKMEFLSLKEMNEKPQEKVINIVQAKK